VNELLALLALLWLPFAGTTGDKPLGEPLSRAAAKFGLSASEVADIRAAGGEFSCPGDGTDGARLNGWLIAPDRVMTNAHGIIESEEHPGRPYLRQPLSRCGFVSFRELGTDRAELHAVNLNGLGAVLRPGAKAPVDPNAAIGGDIVRLRLKAPVEGGVPLALDPAPIARGDRLLLVSRVPTAYQTATLPGDDLLIEECRVVSLDPESADYGRGAIIDCNGAPGMSAGVLFGRAGGRLVAKGFLVALEYVKIKGAKDEKLVGAHMLTFDAKFQDWLATDCPFWPTALRVDLCGVGR
jgi:hypothetical protein